MLNDFVDRVAYNTAQKLNTQLIDRTEEYLRQQAKKATLKIPAELKGGLYETDLLSLPNRNAEHHRVLNYNPEGYFCHPVNWGPPAHENVHDLMIKLGLGRLATLSDRVRVLLATPYPEMGQLITWTGCTIYIHSVSGLWFSMFGVEFIIPYGKMRRLNQIRPALETNPATLELLEVL